MSSSLFGTLADYMEHMKPSVEVLGKRARRLKSLSRLFRKIGRNKDLVQCDSSLSGHDPPQVLTSTLIAAR